MWHYFFKQLLVGVRQKKEKLFSQLPIVLSSSSYPGIVHFHTQRVLSLIMYSLIHSPICSFIHSSIIHLPNLCCVLVMHLLVGNGHPWNHSYIQSL